MKSFVDMRKVNIYVGISISVWGNTPATSRPLIIDGRWYISTMSSSVLSAQLLAELAAFCKSDSLSEDDLRAIIERHAGHQINLPSKIIMISLIGHAAMKELQRAYFNIF